MGNFEQLISEDIRLVMLRCLEEVSDYSLNESVLLSALGAFGHHVSRDRVRTEMDWLAEQNLITIDMISDIRIAVLTARGADAACGRATVSGVKRPGPRG